MISYLSQPNSGPRGDGKPCRSPFQTKENSFLVTPLTLLSVGSPAHIFLPPHTNVKKDLIVIELRRQDTTRLVFHIFLYLQGAPSARLLGWVDLDIECSTVCRILLGLVGIWLKLLGRRSRWWNIQIKIRSTNQWDTLHSSAIS